MTLIEEAKANCMNYWEQANKQELRAVKYFEKHEKRWANIILKRSKKGFNIFYLSAFFILGIETDFKHYLMKKFADKHGFKYTGWMGSTYIYFDR